MPCTSILRNIRYSSLLASCRMIACLATLAFSPAVLAADNANMGVYQPHAFPDLTFKDEQGATHTLSGEKGKLTLVHFWATWCGPCIREFPQIDALQQAYGDKGLKIIAISMDGDRNMANVKKFYSEANISHVKIFMDDGTSARSVHIRGMPTSFFIDASGMNIGVAEGASDWNAKDVRDFIEKNLR